MGGGGGASPPGSSLPVNDPTSLPRSLEDDLSSVCQTATQHETQSPLPQLGLMLVRGGGRTPPPLDFQRPTVPPPKGGGMGGGGGGAPPLGWGTAPPVKGERQSRAPVGGLVGRG